ncbi:MAG TPA: hypothetical protein VLL52_06960 [Anaerolineae bacterium]|nr:hypothetical protein [Anaerolineae bacterium]
MSFFDNHETEKEFFYHIGYAIRPIYASIRAYHLHGQELLLPPSVQLAAFDDISVRLIEDLVNNLPRFRHNIEYKSKVVQKESLVPFLTRLESLGYKPIINDLSSLSQDSIVVWNIDDRNKPNHSYLGYIGNAIKFIHQGTNIVPISFEVIGDDSNFVEIQLKLQISCTGFEIFNISDLPDSFWQLTYRQDVNISTILTIMMDFLNLQTVTTWVENKVIPVKTTKDDLTIKIYLARSDEFQARYTQTPALAEVSNTLVTEYVVKRFYPTYVDLSQQIEARLRTSRIDYLQYLQQENKTETNILETLDEMLTTLKQVRQEYSQIIAQMK